jgi:hypothetical protein
LVISIIGGGLRAPRPVIGGGLRPPHPVFSRHAWLHPQPAPSARPPGRFRRRSVFRSRSPRHACCHPLRNAQPFPPPAVLPPTPPAGFPAGRSSAALPAGRSSDRAPGRASFRSLPGSSTARPWSRLLASSLASACVGSLTRVAGQSPGFVGPTRPFGRPPQGPSSRPPALAATCWPAWLPLPVRVPHRSPIRSRHLRLKYGRSPCPPATPALPRCALTMALPCGYFSLECTTQAAPIAPSIPLARRYTPAARFVAYKMKSSLGLSSLTNV